MKLSLYLHHRNLTHPIEAAVLCGVPTAGAALFGVAGWAAVVAAVFWAGFFYGREVRDMEIHRHINFSLLLSSSLSPWHKFKASYRAMWEFWKWTKGSKQDLAYPLIVCTLFAMAGILAVL